MKQNYQRLLDETIRRLLEEGKRPSLLLHSCCAPCSSYVLEYLARYFKITVFYDNPNIIQKEEYRRRVSEQRRLLKELPAAKDVSFSEGRYDPRRFLDAVKGLEGEPEGGKRCPVCFELRLRETARAAREGGFDYFTTTLSISPHKDAGILNEIGSRLSGEYGVPYLYSDFKKREGYKRSIFLSKEFGLYRQDFCGCPFSKKESEQRRSCEQRKGGLSTK